MTSYTRALAMLAAIVVVSPPLTAQAHRYHPYRHYHGYHRYHAYRHAVPIVRPHVLQLTPSVYVYPYAGRVRPYPYARIEGSRPRGIWRPQVRYVAPAPIGRRMPLTEVNPAVPAAAAGGARVIPADAEITILGPDRMTIQLYRKGNGIGLDQ